MIEEQIESLIPEGATSRQIRELLQEIDRLQIRIQRMSTDSPENTQVEAADQFVSIAANGSEDEIL